MMGGIGHRCLCNGVIKKNASAHQLGKRDGETFWEREIEVVGTNGIK
jgi:hypothetical protein